MNIDEFWSIVDRVQAQNADGNMARKCQLLDMELRRLSIEEIKSFENHLRELCYRAYRWDLWGAACLIAGGCGDDSFSDFRRTLISMGRKVYEEALADPDSLAQIDFRDPTYEGYGYVVDKELAARVEEVPGDFPPHPSEPAGEPFNEWAMEARYPKLTARYGHKDSDYEWEKERAAQEVKDEKHAARVAKLLLEAGIVPSCGLVPPFKVVAKVLRTGRAPAATGALCAWEPIELREADYWRIIRHLEQPSAAQRKCQSNLGFNKVRLDPDRVPNDDYDIWIRSLKARGLI